MTLSFRKNLLTKGGAGMTISVKKSHRGQYRVFEDGQYLGLWIGDLRNLDKLNDAVTQLSAQLSAQSEDDPIIIDPNQTSLPLD